MTEREQFSFTATWNLVKRLADQISHPALAVAELIKNAYDADAKKVYVNLEMAMQKDTSKCVAIIHDDGHGMTREDLLTKWSNIGTSANKHFPFSNGGRSKQGGKGLGRFGAWKIGKKVTIATRAKGSPTLGMVIDFTQHHEETPLSDVMTDVLVDPPGLKNYFPNDSTGTRIIIEKFNETMADKSDIIAIQKNTQSLLNPFEPQSDFDIILDLPKKWEKYEVYDFERLTEQALYSYVVEIDSMGQRIEGKWKNNNKYSIDFGKEETIRHSAKKFLDGEKCRVKGVKVWIYHYIKHTNYKELWPRLSNGDLLKGEYDNKLSGFRLYKDNVRVFPYGEPGNDWLQLDYLKNKDGSTKWFGNSQIIAAARFDMNLNKGIIIDKSNREGLEETVGKNQLFKILQALVKDMRTIVNKYDYPKSKPDHMKKPEFEYGRFKLIIGESQNISVRNTGGKIDTNYVITKGKLPKGLFLDNSNGNISGTPTDECEPVTIEVSAGNNQGNYTAELVIEVEKKIIQKPLFPTKIIEDDDDDEEDEDIGGVEKTINKLDNAISNVKNKLNQIKPMMSDREKISSLKLLKDEIEKIIDTEETI